jgi:hypothetical protein
MTMSATVTTSPPLPCRRLFPSGVVAVITPVALAALAALAAGCSSGSPGDGAAPPDGGPQGTSATDSGGGAPVGSDATLTGDDATPGDDASPYDFDAGSDSDGAAPAGFWDASNIPVAKNVMTFKFLNRTNGKYADSEVYWSFKNGNISETHSIADAPTYDMPANPSGRMYFYLCAKSDTTCATDPTKSKYYDFIEHTISATQYNGNTTRVDAFGLKIALRLHCADGFDAAVGEDYQTFQDDRAVTFQQFLAAVPAEFKALAQAPNAPYRIVQPGAAGFDKGEANANYYNSFVDQLWSANGITLAKPDANGSGLGSNPDLSAAIYRHVGAVAGTFAASGKLMNQKLWADSTTFYTAAPADYYAAFWHAHALGKKAYGFPYDDVGGYSSFISHSKPQYMLVAIGW